ncbi:AMP-binding protein [Nocardioides solisilvae]|uniref:AMP-binding protein n=1 Tax=Nocardioides solisilvae TaxID=1542435 RepID=UPI001EF473E7|nr:AMP-binding protein [Nocardioides solisilvae]
MTPTSPSPLAPSPEADVAVRQLADWLDADEPERLLLETSGSTGLPKRVLLPRDAVVASARASARRLGSQGRWALHLPTSYVAGVQVVVRSLLAGHPPVVGAWDDGGVPATYTSLVPTQLHRMLRDPGEAAALAALRAVLVGGAGTDPALRADAEAAGIRVVATYGASETAGGCVYDGVPLDGVAVTLGTDGRIRLGGPTLFDGYLDDPALTAEVLVDGWYLTADAGRLDEDGRLRVLGRLDDVVVSGGVNVPLPAVAARLREHPDVEQAEVVGVPDEEWGHRVVAWVRPRPGASPTLDGLRAWVAGPHPRSWAPRQLELVAQWPLLGNGKVDRLALARRASGGSDA